MVQTKCVIEVKVKFNAKTKIETEVMGRGRCRKKGDSMSQTLVQRQALHRVGQERERPRNGQQVGQGE